jgi:sec-independent protein translocase protein TatC
MKSDVEMTFGEHLEELRTRVIRALAGVLVATVLCAIFHETMFTILLWPYKRASEMGPLRLTETVMERLGIRGEESPEGPPAVSPEASPGEAPPAGPEPLPVPPPGDPAVAERIERLERAVQELRTELEEFREGTDRKERHAIIPEGPIEPYLTLVIMCVLVGLLVSSPWVIYQVWAFVGVGLYPHERRYIHIYGPISFCLFVVGATAFYLASPYFIQALQSPTKGIELIQHTYLLGKYAKFIALLTLVFGIAFQTPLVVMFLGRTGIVPLETLAGKRKIVVLVMMCVGAILTPSDPFSMIALAVPLILLYEVGILLVRLGEHRRSRRETAEAEDLEEP